MPTLSNEAKNAAVDAVTALLDGGRCRVYTSGNTLLADLALGTPAFGAAVAGVATANAITADVADNSGVADYVTLTKSDNTETIRLAAGGSQRITASSSSGLLLTTATAHGYTDATPVRAFAETGGTLPTGLTAGTTYYVRDAAALTFKIETSVGAGAIAYTDAGAGNFRVKLAATEAALASKDATVTEGVSVSVASLALSV